MFFPEARRTLGLGIPAPPCPERLRTRYTAVKEIKFFEAEADSPAIVFDGCSIEMKTGKL